MPCAFRQGKVVAASDRCEKVEGNVYFPPTSVRSEFFAAGRTTTLCGGKGTTDYFTVIVDGLENKVAAWYYADPKPRAAAHGRVE